MNEKNKKSVYLLTYGAAIAAIYIALTMMFMPISFGPVQFRISEALCVLPYFTPAAVPGLFIGCLLSNLLAGAMTMDVIFGSIATLIGAVGSYVLRGKPFSGAASSDYLQRSDRSMDSAVCLRIHGFDSCGYGDSGNRRDSGCGSAGKRFNPRSGAL